MLSPTFLIVPLAKLVLEGWDMRCQYHDLWETQDYLEKMYPVLESLRNRSWQNQAQDSYYGGYLMLQPFIREVVAMVCSNFEDLAEFVSFFVRKDMVLQFRLRTNY